MFEVENKANFEVGDFQIIEHLAQFVIGYPVNDFGVYHHCIANDEIGDIVAVTPL